MHMKHYLTSLTEPQKSTSSGNSEMHTVVCHGRITSIPLSSPITTNRPIPLEWEESWLPFIHNFAILELDGDDPKKMLPDLVHHQRKISWKTPPAWRPSCPSKAGSGPGFCLYRFHTKYWILCHYKEETPLPLDPTRLKQFFLHQSFETALFR